MGKSSLKSKFIQAFIMGLLFAVMMAVFGVVMGEKFQLWQFVFHFTFFGTIMGFLLPVITERATKKMMQKTIIALNEHEQLLFEGASTAKNTSFSTGGKLILTNKRLAFKPNKLNLKNTVIEIPLHEIMLVGKKSTFGFIHNIFTVKTKRDEFEFIVYENERAAWVSKITEYSGKAV